MNKVEFSKALGWKLSNLSGRLNALGMLETCGRCGGSGKYSFNLTDGDKCYGCMGLGRTYPTFTAKLLATVQTKVAAGELESYLADCRAKNAARAAIAPMVAKAAELSAPINAAYEAAYQARTIVRDEGVSAARQLVIALVDGYTYMGITPKCIEHMAISEIESAMKRGKIDYITAERMIQDRLAMLTELAAAWMAQ